ncbi:MAG: hypothetical protein HY096_01025 [Nitrospinae bacterium]|nr:hypothetical protein [Nitrospinota bacterium]
MQKRFIDKRISRQYAVGSRQRHVCCLLLTAYSLLFLSGCAERSPYRYYNIYTLVEPEVIKNGIKQPPSYDKEFEDDRIAIKFTFKEKKIYFRLKNKTDKELKILWDRLSFVDSNGDSQRVTGFKNIFTDKMDKQPVQEIRAKTEINDLIVPIDNIELMEEWTWYVRPLFNQTDEQSIANMGKIFSISMPIEIAGDVIDYNYKFRIDHVVPQSTWVY